ncbi:enoyl-CoA hydratase-related protein [Mariniluteicoccus endophyticus]
MSQPVTITVSKGVATLRLDRPESMNSFDRATRLALIEAVQQVGADPEVRVVVITGSGRAFGVGQDLKEHLASLQSGSVEQVWRVVPEEYNPLVRAVAELEKPFIAAVNGVAAGAGASLAFLADFRVVARSAGFNTAFAGIALSCDTGASWTLQRLVGQAKAIELMLLPRTVGAEEALELGIASEVVDDDQLEGRVAELAGQLAQGPTLSYASIKHSVAYAATHTLEESIEVESQMMARTGASADHRVAVDAFLAKQKPQFEGR